MSENSDRDQVVKQILDRVASGELTSADAAVLIAAATNAPTEPPPPSQPGPAGEPAAPIDPAGPSQPGPAGEPDQETQPSTPSQPGPAGEPAPADEPPPPSQPGEAGEPTDARRSADVWATATDDPRATKRPQNPLTDSVPGSMPGTGQPKAADTESGAGSAGRVQDSVVEDGELDQERDEHADVPIPAGVRKVMIKAIGRRVRLIGEPAVTGVAVDGPHLIKRDGDTLIVSSDGDMGVSIDGLSMLTSRSVGDLRSVVGGIAKELSVRVNPRLAVEVEVTGGSVSTERVPSLNRVRVTAGMAKVSDVDGPIDLLVQAGSASLDAQLTKGRSRVRVESGSANVQLRRGSDVRVHSDAQLGRVTWIGAVNGHSTDVEIGQGRAALDVEVLMGAAQITAD